MTAPRVQRGPGKKMRWRWCACASEGYQGMEWDRACCVCDGKGGWWDPVE